MEGDFVFYNHIDYIFSHHSIKIIMSEYIVIMELIKRHVEISNKVYKNNDFSYKDVTNGQFHSCKFINCNFSCACLYNTKFTACEFIDCNCSYSDWEDSSLPTFIQCDMFHTNINQ